MRVGMEFGGVSGGNEGVEDVQTLLSLLAEMSSSTSLLY